MGSSYFSIRRAEETRKDSRARARERETELDPSASADPDLKPPELQSSIENFCLGTRRLHLYGSPHSLRRGWLTLSAPSSKPTFSPESVVHPVEREGTASEQRERWGAPREWTRDEWEARWRKKRVPVSMIGGGGGGSQQQGGGAPDVQRVDTLLPYVEGACVCVSLSLARISAASSGAQLDCSPFSSANTHPVASPPPPRLLQNWTRSVRNLPRCGTESLLRVVSDADAAPASASLGAASSRKEPPSPPTRSTCRPVQTSPRTGTVSDAVADEDEVEEEVGIITTTTG